MCVCVCVCKPFVHFSLFLAKAHIPTYQSFSSQIIYSVYVCVQMLDKGLENIFCEKSNQTLNILGTAAHTVSVPTTQICLITQKQP